LEEEALSSVVGYNAPLGRYNEVQVCNAEFFSLLWSWQ
jgi:hypothetical protein